jgi:iron complex transport system permease protein
MRRAIILLSSIVLVTIIALAVSTLCGSTGCTTNFATDALSETLIELRGLRTYTAFVVGGLLALAGALMQILLRNPLADPYILGISGGAAAGASIALTAAAYTGLHYEGSAAIGAAAGAGLSVFLLFSLAYRSLQRISLSVVAQNHRLLLTGVMLASGFGAIVTLVLTMSEDTQLRGIIFWMMGDIEGGYWVHPAAIILLIATLGITYLAPALNLLTRGEANAHLLGVPVKRLRWIILSAASLLTAAAVTVAGTIGFIGLVVPHGLRLLIGNDQRLLLPASVFVGGAALALADLVARVIVAPVQLPVGVITAFIGVPVFLWLLSKGRA